GGMPAPPPAVTRPSLDAVATAARTSGVLASVATALSGSPPPAPYGGAGSRRRRGALRVRGMHECRSCHEMGGAWRPVDGMGLCRRAVMCEATRGLCTGTCAHPGASEVGVLVAGAGEHGPEDSGQGLRGCGLPGTGAALAKQRRVPVAARERGGTRAA